MTIRVVEAEVTDAAIIARLHATSWQAHYSGILPDDYLVNEAPGERAAYWEAALPAGEYSLVLLAIEANEPVAFIAVKNNADLGYDATIEHLHVLQTAQGRGIGRRLLHEAAKQLAARGAGSVCLWVFEANKAAIGFYESLGGLTDAHGTDKFAGGDAPDRRIGWHDLQALRTACGRAARS